MFVNWNPWHGCSKISPGCKYCYVYRQDKMYGIKESSQECKKNNCFNLPIQLKRNKTFKVPSGEIVFTCFTSDFLLKDADEWRPECWKMMKTRDDLWFYFFTKRIDRLQSILPEDWGNGYDNVLIGCTIENQAMANYRLPIFMSLPIKHKSIIVAPILEQIDLTKYLDNSIEEVAVSGESGMEARICNYDWILDIRQQCVNRCIPFRFHQTGAHFVKDGKLYNIKRSLQISQARKANIDFRINKNGIPETAAYNKK